jgi:hypothetical protein
MSFIRYFLINFIFMVLGLITFYYYPLVERLIVVGLGSDFNILILIICIMIYFQPILLKKRNYFGLDYVSSFILGVFAHISHLTLFLPYIFILLIKFSIISREDVRKQTLIYNPIEKTMIYQKIKKYLDLNK